MEKTIQIQGVQVPRIGLGTWDLRGSEAERAIESALELGYRHIDTAEMYRNEAEIGRALARAEVPRDELFLVSKVLSSNLRTSDVIEACRRSLEKLRTEYLDLYLIHSPNDRVPIEETMAGLDRLIEEGRVRHIGVSNFSVRQLEEARAASAYPLLTNQVHFHLHYRQDDMVAYCNREGLLLTAYTPLARARLKHEAVLQEMGERYGKSPLQIALRWLLQQGNVVAIPKSSKRQNQRENLTVFDFNLAAEDMERLEASL